MLFDNKFQFRTGSAHDWGFCSSCVSMVHEQVLSWWWNIQNLLTDFIDLLKRDQSLFFTLPSSGLGISITDTFDVNCMLAQDQLTSDQRFCSSSVLMIHELAWNYWVDDGTPIIFSRGTSYCIQSGQSSGLSMGGEFDKRESTWHESAFLWALRLLRCCHGGPKQSVRFTPTAKNATPQLQQDTRTWKWAFI